MNVIGATVLPVSSPLREFAASYARSHVAVGALIALLLILALAICAPLISPQYMADRCRFSRTIWAVSEVVCVIQHEICSPPGFQPRRCSPVCSTWNKSSIPLVS